MALMKPSKQSSTYGNKPENRAKNANDGDTSTSSATSYLQSQWWSVDLERMIHLSCITLHLFHYAVKKKYYQGALVETRVHIGDDWTLCADIPVPYQSTPYVVDVRCKGTTNARFVRVYLPIKSVLYLAEVEVFGKLVES